MNWGGGTLGKNIRLRGIVWDGAQFLTAGYDYEFGATPGWRGVIYTSPDGSSWTRHHYGGEELRNIATGGGIHVTVGDAGTIWRSTDGVSWAPIPSGTSMDLKGVSYGGGQFVAVGSGSPGNSGGPAVVLTSTDGSSWSDESAGAGTASWQGFYDVQYCNDRFLASGWFSKIRHSTDGGTSFATTRSTTEQIPAFAYGNGTYLAAGIDKENSDAPTNLISTDGVTWSTVDTFLLWRLTGGASTSPMPPTPRAPPLYDIATGEGDDTLLDNDPRHRLRPRIRRLPDHRPRRRLPRRARRRKL